MNTTVKLLMSKFVTHDVKRFIVDKPKNFRFTPGQGIELFINQPEWRDEEGRPFTPTSLNDDQVLEFTIKRYAEHKGVTDKLHSLKPGDELLISEPFGTIAYKGPGLFLAAGAGLTPFLSIFRDIARSGPLDGHGLIFSNKKAEDIICEKELRHYFGDHARFTLSREKNSDYLSGRIDKKLIDDALDKISPQFCYVCGPDEFVESMNSLLVESGCPSENLVFEE